MPSWRTAEFVIATRQVGSDGTPNGTLVHELATVTFPSGSVSQGHDLVVASASSIHLEMEEDHDPAKPGDALSYSMIVANPTAQSLPLSIGRVLTASLSVGTSFVAATAGGTLSGSTVTWNAGSVAAGGHARFGYTVTVGVGRPRARCCKPNGRDAQPRHGHRFANQRRRRLSGDQLIDLLAGRDR